MRFQNHTERLAWRNNPDDGIAIVGSAGYCHEVVAVNPSEEERAKLLRHGASLFVVPEDDAAVIDGKAWYSEDDSESTTPLPNSARRAKA